MFKRLQTLCLLAFLSAGNAANAQYVFTKIDINPGSADSNPIDFFSCDTLMYLQANDGTHGSEPWLSDGTIAGTRMLKDINPGGAASEATWFCYYKGKTYFSASDGVNGKELWVTDGTAANTQMLADLNPGAASSVPESLVVCNDKLFFEANNGINGVELWVTDGTAANTQMLKDIKAGAATSRIGNIMPHNNVLLFSADNGTDGIELWRSDGTPAGTYMVKDIAPGASSSMLADNNGIVLFKGKVLFPANDNTITDREIWETDGTEAGTKLSIDYKGANWPSRPWGDLTVCGSKLYFRGYDTAAGGGVERLFVSDGITATPLFRTDGTGPTFPGDLTPLDDKLYFTGDHSTAKNELWVTDGTNAGTDTAFNYNKDTSSIPGGNNSNIHNVFVYGSHLFMHATTTYISSNNGELVASDGTPSGTRVLAPPTADVVGSMNNTTYHQKILNNKLFIRANFETTSGTELWIITDTTLTDTATSVNNVKPSPAFYTLAPNPANDVLQVTLNSSHADGHISITDMTGRRLFEKTVTTGEKVHTISTTDMPAGTYIFSYTALGTTTTKKFVIQR